MKPGLSSPLWGATIQLTHGYHYTTSRFYCQTLKQLPPTNSLINELLGISSPGAARKYPKNLIKRLAVIYSCFEASTANNKGSAYYFNTLNS